MSMSPEISRARYDTPPPPPEASAGWILDLIQLENFKSYHGATTIAPLHDFHLIGISGPNGSGKSNLMDAISFVMGERNNCLRVKRMDDLIHGASIGKSTSRTASVTAVFRKTNEDSSQSEMKFKRVIRGTSSEYLVNDRTVLQTDYFDELKQIGINAKAKNFLAFQGDIESIALKNSKERSTLLEEISGSVAFKADYDNAKARLDDLSQRTENAHVAKKAILAEKKGVKMEVNVANCFNDLLEEMAKKETEIALFKLYHLDQENFALTEELMKANISINTLERSLKVLNEQIESKKKERVGLSREESKFEMELKKLEDERNKKMPEVIRLKTERKHIQKKLQNAENSLKQAENQHKTHEQDMRILQKNLDQAKNELESFLAGRNATSENGNDVSLKDNQIQEYLSLKQEVMKRTLTERTATADVEKERKDKEQVYMSLNREKATIETQLNMNDLEIKEEKRLVQKLKENISSLKEHQETKERDFSPLQVEVKNAEAKIGELSLKLEELTATLDAAKTNKNQMKRLQQKQEVVEMLKANCSGVFGRLADLCQPVNPKYQIAITKAIGDRMNAIVVETAKSASECIMYLKEQLKERELFLPLDLLQVKPLKTRLRNLKDQNVYLVYDLLTFDKNIEIAIRHCTKSTVVCPSPEVASQISNGELGEATNAVSMNGTMYFSNGIVSGGTADLRRKAERWNDQRINEKEEQKRKLQEELREALKIQRNSFKLMTLEQEIRGYKKRVEYAVQGLQRHEERLEQLEDKRKQIQAELKMHTERWENAKTELSLLDDQLKDFEKQIGEKEDQIFASFCKRVGISNIRVYEEQDVRAHEEFQRDKQQFETKILEIQVKVTDGNGEKETLEINLKRWKETVKKIVGDLKECQRAQEKVDNEMKGVETKISKAKSAMEDLRHDLKEKVKEIADSTLELAKKEKLLVSEQKEISHLNVQSNQIKARRLEILKRCKVSDIQLPLVTGSLGHLCTEDASNLEEEIDFDFQGLSDELKDLEGADVGKTEKKLEDQLADIEKRVGAFNALNLNADEKWNSILEKQRKQQAEYEDVVRQVRDAKRAFQEIKRQRYDSFMACYEKMSANIDAIYKDLTQSESAQAVLGLENPEEPYLDGVSYHCVAPGKTFQSMNNLSGGEKALAALALLFAIQTFEPAPFFVLDEIDAALDKRNIEKVKTYLRRKSQNLQLLVISLKSEFIDNADAIVGVAPKVEPSACVRSQVITLDLTRYAN